MDSALAAVRRPEDLLAAYAGELGQGGGPMLPVGLPVGTVMFCGAIGAIGGIRPAPRFELELEDPVLGRTLRHGYDIRVLPIVV